MPQNVPDQNIFASFVNSSNSLAEQIIMMTSDQTGKMILAFLLELKAQEHYNAADQQWQFADGSPCVECTRSAECVARRFHGKVFGYWAADNPTAMIGSKFGEGHDFAIVADRWLVDYWTWHVTGLIDDPILDLEDPNAQVLISRLYGHDSRWTSIH